MQLADAAAPLLIRDDHRHDVANSTTNLPTSPVLLVHNYATQTSEPLSDLLEEVGGQFYAEHRQVIEESAAEYEQQYQHEQLLAQTNDYHQYLQHYQNQQPSQSKQHFQFNKHEQNDNQDPSNLQPSVQFENDDQAVIDEDPIGLDSNNNDINRAEQTIDALRSLLAAERERNEERKRNNQSLRQYLSQMQTDYLRLQNDLVEALKLAHKVKAQKESQIERMDDTLREKDLLIKQLKESLDGNKVREEFQALLEKSRQLAETEKEQLREQVNTVEQQLVCERVSNSQTLQQFHQKLEEQRQTYEQEVERLRKSQFDLESKYEQLLTEPKNLLVQALREERNQLAEQLDELKLVLQNSQSKYDSLRKQLENLLQEQEQQEQSSQEEIERILEQQSEQRHSINELQQKLDERQELNEILKFNLQRSEKRAKNLFNALKTKEATYKEMLDELQVSREQEVEQSRNSVRALERKVVELEAELDRKQNELIRVELTQENQLESIRNDRDQRINRLIQEKAKVDKELQVTENRLAREIEQNSQRMAQVEQLQSESSQFREETKRLSMELVTCEARLSSKQQELNELLERQVKVDQRAADEGDRIEEVSFELEEAKEHCKRLEVTIEDLRRENEKLCTKLAVNESHLSKVNGAINKERTKLFEQFESKLEQMKVEQSVYDRNKIRYKRYGYKLKKYCEHLRQVHEHLCNPTICGYIIGGCRPQTTTTPPPPPQTIDFFTATTTTPINKKVQTREDKNKNSDRSKAAFSSLLDIAANAAPSLTAEPEPHYADHVADCWNVEQQKQQPKIAQVKENIICCNSSGFQTAAQSQRESRDRFSIKRTGLSTTTKTTIGRYHQSDNTNNSSNKNGNAHWHNQQISTSLPPKSSRRQCCSGKGESLVGQRLTAAESMSINSQIVATPESHNYYYINESGDFVGEEEDEEEDDEEEEDKVADYNQDDRYTTTTTSIAIPVQRLKQTETGPLSRKSVCKALI